MLEYLSRIFVVKHRIANVKQFEEQKLKMKLRIGDGSKYSKKTILNTTYMLF